MARALFAFPSGEAEEQALALLRERGYVQGPDGIWVPSPELLTKRAAEEKSAAAHNLFDK